MPTNDEKIVEFWKWCDTCKHRQCVETEDPCNECLTIGARENSHKPEKYEPCLWIEERSKKCQQTTKKL